MFSFPGSMGYQCGLEYINHVLLFIFFLFTLIPFNVSFLYAGFGNSHSFLYANDVSCSGMIGKFANWFISLTFVEHFNQGFVRHLYLYFPIFLRVLFQSLMAVKIPFWVVFPAVRFHHTIL